MEAVVVTAAARWPTDFAASTVLAETASAPLAVPSAAEMPHAKSSWT